MSKDWSGGWCPPGCSCEEWSVHAHLTLNPQQAGNITVTTEGTRGDSGYGSEKGVYTPTARATCSVTLGGHHTVTLTCAEIPVPPVVPQQRERWVYCNHHDKQRAAGSMQTAPPHPTASATTATPQPPSSASAATAQPPPSATTATPQPPPPVYKDAASQTSSSQIPQLLLPQPGPVEEPKNLLDPRTKGRALRRSPARLKRHPRSSGSPNSGFQNKSTASSSDGKKNPRTVHIDVYCTGSESSDASSSDEETTSTPQTVFESDRVRVVHQRANSDTLPHAIQRQKRCVLSNPSVPSMGSSVSSGYPSAMSSLVSGTDGLSLTSGSILSSAAVTSAKDTDFSSRDSFDYENSFDKLRIREKEKLWATHRSYAKTIEESSESSSDSEEGLAWSFERGLLKREDTVRRPSEMLRKCSSAKAELSKSSSLSDSEASSLKYKREALRKPCEIDFRNLAKAKKFGPIVASLKKPGHHVGPSKNPNCTCDTCRYFFEHVCCRNRTRSLGEGTNHPFEL